MKRILMFLLLYALCLISFAQQIGTFNDPRDGKTYKWVKIGNQVWMAENLAYKPSSGNYWAYDNNSSNVAKYGYLYDWQTARNVCPTGWHLPSDIEWSQLTDFVGGEDIAGTQLKAKSNWNRNGNGTDDYGFSALPGSLLFVTDSTFFSLGDSGNWWTSTEVDAMDAWCWFMTYYDGNVNRDYNDKGFGFSVRCLLDK